MNYKMKKGKTIYLFIDESGNFDFSNKGTKYFVLTSLVTSKPSLKRYQFLNLKYKLLKLGTNLEFFHATEDKQFVRDKVFSILNKFENDIIVNSVIIDKIKTKMKHHDSNLFYRETSRVLLYEIFEEVRQEEVNNVVVVLGAIFTRDKQAQIQKVLKEHIKSNFSVPFEIYFHKSQSDINSQLADYFGWAIYVKFEKSEIRPFNLIKGIIKSTNPSILSEEPEGSY